MKAMTRFKLSFKEAVRIRDSDSKKSFQFLVSGSSFLDEEALNERWKTIVVNIVGHDLNLAEHCDQVGIEYREAWAYTDNLAQAISMLEGDVKEKFIEIFVIMASRRIDLLITESMAVYLALGMSRTVVEYSPFVAEPIYDPKSDFEKARFLSFGYGLLKGILAAKSSGVEDDGFYSDICKGMRVDLENQSSLFMRCLIEMELNASSSYMKVFCSELRKAIRDVSSIEFLL